MSRHTCDWRLTTTGIEQAKKAGDWLRQNGGVQFHRYYSSHFMRALETAALLNLPGAQWFKNHYLVERNWGLFDRYTPEQKAKIFAEDFKSREINSFYWAPPRGESMLALCLRVEKVINTLYRECDGQDVIIVAHGEIIWAFRIILERITLHDYIQLDESEAPQNKIHNCQIVEYSRLDPQTGQQWAYLNRMRSVCPWDPNLSSNDWQEIKRPSFTNEQLLKFVGRTDRLIDN